LKELYFWYIKDSGWYWGEDPDKSVRSKTNKAVGPFASWDQLLFAWDRAKEVL